MPYLGMRYGLEPARNALAEWQEENAGAKARSDRAVAAFTAPENQRYVPPTELEKLLTGLGQSFGDAMWAYRGQTPVGRNERQAAEHIYSNRGPTPEELEAERRAAIMQDQIMRERVARMNPFPQTEESIQQERVAELLMRMKQGHKVDLNEFPPEYVHVMNRPRNALAEE